MRLITQLFLLQFAHVYQLFRYILVCLSCFFMISQLLATTLSIFTPPPPVAPHSLQSQQEQLLYPRQILSGKEVWKLRHPLEHGSHTENTKDNFIRISKTVQQIRPEKSNLSDAKARLYFIDYFQGFVFTISHQAQQTKHMC